MISDKPWIGIPEVATHLHVSGDTVYRWVDAQVWNGGNDTSATYSPGIADRNSGDGTASG